ncbi:hypothetical protein [Qipengyuania sp. 902]|uniref:terminase small subunit-like protein n=1 Tax=Qipengyuania sp. 902 TaxID=3417565 RepID=UPI003EBF3177
MSENTFETGTDIQVGQYARVPARVGEGELTPIQQEICDRVMNCESVRSICEDTAMPSRTTVLKWLAQSESFRTAYALAQLLSSDQLEEEVIEIADDSKGDFVDGEKGKEFDREHVARAKLRIDARIWAASKRNPKKYGTASTLNFNDVQAQKREHSRAEIAARLAAMIEDRREQGLLPDLSEGED